MAEVVKSEERPSKDGRFKFAIEYYSDGSWEVYCLRINDDGEFTDVHWSRGYRDEAKARAEYLRFD